MRVGRPARASSTAIEQRRDNASQPHVRKSSKLYKSGSLMLAAGSERAERRPACASLANHRRAPAQCQQAAACAKRHCASIHRYAGRPPQQGALASTGTSSQLARSSPSYKKRKTSGWAHNLAWRTTPYGDKHQTGRLRAHTTIGGACTSGSEDEEAASSVSPALNCRGQAPSDTRPCAWVYLLPATRPRRVLQLAREPKM